VNHLVVSSDDPDRAYVDIGTFAVERREFFNVRRGGSR
jgi:hypothetical protein